MALRLINTPTQQESNLKIDISINITETDNKLDVSAMLPEDAEGTLAYALAELLMHEAQKQIDALNEREATETQIH